MDDWTEILYSCWELFPQAVTTLEANLVQYTSHMSFLSLLYYIWLFTPWHLFESCYKTYSTQMPSEGCARTKQKFLRVICKLPPYTMVRMLLQSLQRL